MAPTAAASASRQTQPTPSDREQQSTSSSSTAYATGSTSSADFSQPSSHTSGYQYPQQTRHRPRWYQNIRQHLSDHPPSATWTSSNERSLLEPYTYLASRPGKEVRSKLIDAFNFWLQVPEPQLGKVRKVVEMLHNASLLMDDVEDNSDLRRGMPVAHKVYGTPQVLNSANYIYFLVFREVEAMAGSSSRSSRAFNGSEADAALPSDAPEKAARSERLLVEEMINLHRGQGLDLLWRDTLQCPTEEEYVEMVRNKTGGLLRIAGGLMLIWSGSEASDSGPKVGSNQDKHVDSTNGNPAAVAAAAAASPPKSKPDLLPLLDLIGLLFQIRDDYMNLDSDTYAQNKGFAEDLTEGKFSFPMIHGIRWSDSLQRYAEQGDEADTAASDTSTTTKMPLQPPSLPSLPKSVARTALDSPILGPPPMPHRVSSFSRSSFAKPNGDVVTPGTSLSSTPPNRQLLSILSSRPTDEHLKRYAISYLRDVSRSFDYCRKVMRELDDAIWAELQSVEDQFGRIWSEHRRQGHSNGSRSRDEERQEMPVAEDGCSGRNEGLRKILLALRQGWWEEAGNDDNAEP